MKAFIAPTLCKLQTFLNNPEVHQPSVRERVYLSSIATWMKQWIHRNLGSNLCSFRFQMLQNEMKSFLI